MMDFGNNWMIEKQALSLSTCQHKFFRQNSTNSFELWKENLWDTYLIVSCQLQTHSRKRGLFWTKSQWFFTKQHSYWCSIALNISAVFSPWVWACDRFCMNPHEDPSSDFVLPPTYMAVVYCTMYVQCFHPPYGRCTISHRSLLLRLVCYFLPTQSMTRRGNGARQHYQTTSHQTMVRKVPKTCDGCIWRMTNISLKNPCGWPILPSGTSQEQSSITAAGIYMGNSKVKLHCSV